MEKIPVNYKEIQAYSVQNKNKNNSDISGS